MGSSVKCLVMGESALVQVAAGGFLVSSNVMR